jgi:hypothetical protein
LRQADHGHNITMPARLGPQNAKAILGIMVRDALDEGRQHFLGRRFRLRNHADRRIICVRPLRAHPMPNPRRCSWTLSLCNGESAIAVSRLAAGEIRNAPFRHRLDAFLEIVGLA